MALIDGAKRCGAWILEDDYDSEFRHDGPPLAAMQGLVDDAPVVYLGTFSKSLFPALRLGYMVLPKALMARVALPSTPWCVGGGRRASWLWPSSSTKGNSPGICDACAGCTWSGNRPCVKPGERFGLGQPPCWGRMRHALTVSASPLDDQRLAEEALRQGLSPRPLAHTARAALMVSRGW